MKSVAVIVVCFVFAFANARSLRKKRASCDPNDFKIGIFQAASSTSCNAYYQCRRSGDADPIEASCDVGLFYRHPTGCMYAKNVQDCSMDPCLAEINEYAHDSVCGAYCTCENGRTSVCMCCGTNQRYNYNSGSRTGSCVDDTSCQDQCVIPPIPIGVCRLAAVSGKPYHYINSDPDNPNTDNLECAPGTIFSLAVCGCEHTDAADARSGEACTELSYVPFDSDLSYDIQDVKGNWIDNSQMPNAPAMFATSPTGFQGTSMGTFNGAGTYLKASLFTSLDFGDDFRFELSFRSAGSLTNPGQGEVLFATSDCRSRLTGIEVTYARESGSVSATVTTGDNTVTVTSRNAQLNQWNNLVLDYDGANLMLTVNNVDNTESLTGTVVVVPAALSIGGLDVLCGKQGLHGYMDEFRFFKCER